MITFAGIPQVFTALRVIWSARSDNSNPATYMCVRLNGDSSSGDYEWQINQANNSSMAGSGNPGSTVSLIQVGTMAAATATAGYFGGGEFTIPNPGGNVYKNGAGYSNSMNSTSNGYSGTYGGQLLSTAPVTLLSLFAEAGNLVAGTSATLYGM